MYDFEHCKSRVQLLKLTYPLRLRLHGAKDREKEKVEEREKLAKATASPSRSSRSSSISASKVAVVKMSSSEVAEPPSTGKGKRGAQSRNARSAGVVLDLAMNSEREDDDGDFEVDELSDKELSGSRAKKLSKGEQLCFKPCIQSLKY